MHHVTLVLAYWQLGEKPLQELNWIIEYPELEGNTQGSLSPAPGSEQDKPKNHTMTLTNSLLKANHLFLHWLLNEILNFLLFSAILLWWIWKNLSLCRRDFEKPHANFVRVSDLWLWKLMLKKEPIALCAALGVFLNLKTVLV